MRIFVTVGMSRFPFDRLLAAVAPLCAEHEVFAQTGPSRVSLQCETMPFLSFEGLIARLACADVIICHAGNVVRVAQRQEKVPLAAARHASRAEAANDHQVEFLKWEKAAGSVVAIDDMERLPELVASHAAAEARILRERSLSPPTDGAVVARVLDEVATDVVDNPFRSTRWRHYAYAWNRLHRLRGNHLDLGGAGKFVDVLAKSSELRCYRADLSSLAGARHRRRARRSSLFTRASKLLPFPSSFFSSISAFNVVDQFGYGDELLEEIARVLAPAGTLVVKTRHGCHASLVASLEGSHFSVVDTRQADRWQFAAVPSLLGTPVTREHARYAIEAGEASISSELLLTATRTDPTRGPSISGADPHWVS
jgi:ubiquinone/menaquinone biosynthesis C-methylase UbiE/UDP-N-acetylglucosamine transferase subunit ALG13